MPACAACGAFVGEDGKWAPANHLSQVCTERDKAIKEAGELRWAVSSAELSRRTAEEKLGQRADVLKKATEEIEIGLKLLRTPGIMLFDAEAKFENAVKLLKEIA
jgi:translation elongation factor EF-1beta